MSKKGFNTITFTLDIDPKRFFQERPRLGRGDHFYDPSRSKKDVVLALCKQYRPDKPFEGAVGVDLEFRNGQTPCIMVEIMQLEDKFANTERPDGDNIEKLLLDVFQEAGFIKNDSQVARMIWQKTQDEPEKEKLDSGTGD